MTVYSIVGTISGTSADGIDLAEIATDGETIHRFGPAATLPYKPETRAAVLAAIADGPRHRSDWPSLAEKVTQDHGDALESFMRENALQPDFVVFHGQTVWHDPNAGETVQLGDPQALANRLQIPVIGDVRQADIVAGGEGAPLVPVYHRALALRLDPPAEGAICFLNIGGVSNLTYIDGDTLLAFDIGPGNALLDDWVRLHGGGEFDRNGAISKRGKVDETRLQQAFAHPFFKQAWPKSLDRNAFSLVLAEGLSLEDGAATLAAFTAAAIAASEQLLPKVPELWIVCGGGRLNPTLMAELATRLAGSVLPSDRFGIDGDALEAQAMAFLGARRLANLPTSYPQTTGAREPVVGGTIYWPVP